MKRQVAPPPLVLTEATAAAVFAPAPHPLVLADTAAAAVLASAPLPPVLADTAATTVFAPIPLPLVLAEIAAAAVFTPESHPLVLADAAAAAVFTLAPLPLVLEEPAAAAVFTPAPHPLVLAQGWAGLLGCRRLGCQGRGWAIGWARTMLSPGFPLGCPLIQHPLFARSGDLLAIQRSGHITRAFFTDAPRQLVPAQGPGLEGRLGCSRMWI